MEGTWDSGPRCGEAFETRYRWRVSLLQDAQGKISGTIHFHNCPGGGQAVYHVSGDIHEPARPIALQGTRVGGAGDLVDNVPEFVTFRVTYGRPPEPNYAP